MFDTTRISEYEQAAVEAELVQLFPDVSRKGLKLEMWYEDDLAGKVVATYYCNYSIPMIISVSGSD